MTFESLGLSEPLLRAVRANGYTTPTPVQRQAIPAILGGNDIMAAAQTGTGKTAGFTLPLLQLLSHKPPVTRKQVHALVLTPTRELAAQVQDSVLTYGKYLELRSTVVFGGVNINQQIRNLSRGVDILVATPGRLLDLYQQHTVRLNKVEILVLDEGDRMLDMGFINDIKKIMALLPKARQNLLFSATFSSEIRQLARSITRHPVEIDVSPRNSTVASIMQKFHPVDRHRKAELLSHLIHTENWFQALVFSRTKHGADKLVKQLMRNNIHASAIHGNKSQAQRIRTLADFKKNRIRILVATDIASRGLDIDQLSQVVNFDLPHVPEDYIHRIGRTGRAGANGNAVSLVCADELKQLRDIERLIDHRIEREEIEHFLPQESVTESVSDKPARNKQRSKRNNQRNEQQRIASEKKSHGNKRKPANNSKRNNKPANRNRGAGTTVALAV